MFLLYYQDTQSFRILVQDECIMMSTTQSCIKNMMTKYKPLQPKWDANQSGYMSRVSFLRDNFIQGNLSLGDTSLYGTTLFRGHLSSLTPLFRGHISTGDTSFQGKSLVGGHLFSGAPLFMGHISYGGIYLHIIMVHIHDNVVNTIEFKYGI